MKVAAVIAEYNPFHNGHFYHLDTLRHKINADQIIVIMSGNFTQRGLPAITDKFTRCKMALRGGADLVFELPVYYATGSAEFFAQGAVSLLDKLGVVDVLHFGSEAGDIYSLSACADILAHETASFKSSINAYLKTGLSFPDAQARAVCDAIQENSDNASNIVDILAKPNNTLGIEYIKALKKRDSIIQPVTLKREGSAYHDQTLPFNQPDEFNTHEPAYASADAIRSFLMNSADMTDISSVAPHLPPFVYNIFNNMEIREFIFQEDFSSVMYYSLLNCIHLNKSLKTYYDVTKQISDTIIKNLNEFVSLPQFILQCKSKNLTYNRISRCLMHILLELTEENINQYKDSDYASYARLLGFTPNGRTLLKSIKANASIPIVSKPLRDKKNLSRTALSSLNADIHAAQLYYMIQGQKCRRRAKNEFTQEIVRTPPKQLH